MTLTSYELSSLVATLAYTDQFYYPQTTTELWQRQYKTKLSLDAVQDGLNFLAALKIIKKQANYWHLTIGKARSIIREKRAKHAQEMLVESQVVQKWLVKIPWIKAVGITGSLAMKNPNQRADTDFIIITQAKRLWITRFIVTVMSWWLGKRRNRNSNGEGTWCFNLWLAESSLRLSSARRKSFVAYELCQVEWLFGKSQAIKRFYRQNYWVASFLPVYYQQKIQQISKLSYINESTHENIFLSILFNLIEGLMFLSQRLYMYPHQGREEVFFDRAFFHPRNTDQFILANWIKTLKSL